MTPRRAWSLVRHLPPESATVRAVATARPTPARRSPPPSSRDAMRSFFGGAVTYTPKESANGR